LLCFSQYFFFHLARIWRQALKTSVSPYYAGLVADIDESQAVKKQSQGAQYRDQLVQLMTYLGARAYVILQPLAVSMEVFSWVLRLFR
jgi:hypothetical protein